MSTLVALDVNLLRIICFELTRKECQRLFSVSRTMVKLAPRFWKQVFPEYCDKNLVPAHQYLRYHIVSNILKELSFFVRDRFEKHVFELEANDVIQRLKDINNFHQVQFVSPLHPIVMEEKRGDSCILLWHIVLSIYRTGSPHFRYYPEHNWIHTLTGHNLDFGSFCTTWDELPRFVNALKARGYLGFTSINILLKNAQFHQAAHPKLLQMQYKSW